jgi:hypothetical protein
MLLVSLGMNIAVLVPVCGALILSAPWIERAYGAPTPARAILLCIYLAILTVSVWQLRAQDPRVVASLLAVQVIYKVLTPIAVGDLMNPVVISNLLISVVHLFTLRAIAVGTRAATD